MIKLFDKNLDVFLKNKLIMGQSDVIKIFIF